MAEEGYKVSLNVYDLSQGLARQLSASFLGKVIEGIWHTGVVVYGNEYFFGGGIQHCPAGTTPYGTPLRVFELGTTYIPKDVFEGYLEEIRPRYTAETYSLLRHNCNNFSNEVVQFLVGASVPEYILNLPNEVMNSPMGPLIMPMIQNLETTLRAGAVPNAPQFKPNPTSFSPPMAAAVSTTGTVSADGKTASSTTHVTDKNAPSVQKVDVPPVVQPVGGGPEKQADAHGDLLGNARNKIQDEITREFAALMSTGTLRASEAAALATRKVMERYGNTGVALSQS